MDDIGHTAYIVRLRYIERLSLVGKTTRIHPVGLSVIRGAFEYGSYKIGTLKQIQLSANGRRAWYRTQVLKWPNDINPDRAAHRTLIGALRSCFAADIQVTALSRNKQGQWWVDLDCNLDSIVETTEPLFADTDGA